jgi:RNA polymerase sigma-70 factor (ECF subfamily)
MSGGSLLLQRTPAAFLQRGTCPDQGALMPDRPTKWFLRWRDRGDAAALAAAFDRTAPELLRVALHLCGSLADAEDLVQGAFVAAIEGAQRFDRERRLMPWLVSILTHQAQAEQRRRQRMRPAAVEPDALPGGADPARAAAEAELTESTRAAIDRLPEPYRQPTMLRVCHGLAPAEIALLLERSPGTVRAQLHRGLEQLRRGLPAGVVSSLLLAAAPPGRGLAAVKHAVLAAGRQAATAAGVAAVPAFASLTGLAMTKKTATVLALVVGTAALFGLVRPRGGDVAPSPAPTLVSAAHGDAPAVADTPRTGAAAASAAQRETAPYDAGPGSWQLRARVVDGPSRAPIAGAAVALHGPRALTLLELQREFHDVGWPTPTGGIYSWLEPLRALPREFDERLVLGGAPGRFLVPPRAGDAALARIETDADGRFALPVAATGAMVVVTHAGHGARQIPFAAAVDDATIELWPVRRVVGRVLTRSDEPPPRPLDLLLLANDATHSAAWHATTGADGRFTAEVAAQRVNVSCRTHGWTVTRRHGQRIDLTSIDVATGGTVYVTRFGGARLHVTDARSGVPIETIWLLSRDEHGFPCHCGRFFAPNGVFELTSEDLQQILDQVGASGPERMAAVVWSEGHAAQPVGELSLFGETQPLVEVRLEPGALDVVRGRITRAGAPAAGLRVELRPFQRLNWNHWIDRRLDAATSAADGGFALHSPPGEYLLEVRSGDRMELQRPVAVPYAEALQFDLDAAIQVTVEVVDAQGRPVPDHNVMVYATGGLQRTGLTGADGRVTLGPFDPGKLTAGAPRVATKDSWVAAVTNAIVAAAGDHPEVRLRLPSNETIRAVLVFDGEAPATGFEGFTARDLALGRRADAEVAVGADGSVPLELSPGEATLEVAAPDGRHWRFALPADARPGQQLLLRCKGLAYTVALTDLAGKVIAHARVFAAPVGGGVVRSAVTGGDGVARLDGLEPCRHMLTFHVDQRSSYREVGDNPLSMAWFETDAPPASPPVPLQIAAPRFARGGFVGIDFVEITGRALDAATRQPVASATVSFETVFRQQGGELRLFPPSGWQYSTADGSFRILVARGERYRESVARNQDAAFQTADWTPASGDAHLVHDVTVR